MRRIVHQVSIIESLKDDLLFGLDYVFCFTWTTVQDFSISILIICIYICRRCRTQCGRSYGVKYIADTQIIKVLEYFQSVKRVAARYAFSLCATKYTYCMCLKKKI